MKSLVSLLLLAVPVAAQLPLRDGPLPALPSYLVTRATGPITIDGRLDEAAWQSAAAVTLSFFWPGQTGPKEETRVRLLWDDEAIYAAYDCDDVDLTAQHTDRDDPTYEDDCVELFLQPDPTGRSNVYLGLEMNAAGVLYDYLTYHTSAFLKRFQLDGCRLATTQRGTLNQRDDRDTGWSLEVVVPWVNFEGLGAGLPPKDGDRWGLMLNRWNGTAPDRALSLFADTGLRDPSPHNPSRFATLIFAGRAGGAQAGPTPPGGEQPTWDEIDNPVVGFETTKGTVYLELWPDVAPKHSDNMLRLVGDKFYDGIVVHRVEPGFVAQMGCPFTRDNPLDDERIGTGGPDWTVDAEFSDKPHLRGTLSMARTADPNSAGSQFFICLEPARGLDGKYSVFGRVLGDGMTVVDELIVGDRIIRAFIVHE